jgi:hypothetical protein
MPATETVAATDSVAVGTKPPFGVTTTPNGPWATGTVTGTTALQC